MAALRRLSAAAGLGHSVPVPSGGRGANAGWLMARNGSLANGLGLGLATRLAPDHCWNVEPDAAQRLLAEELLAEGDDRASRGNLDSREKARFTALNAYADVQKLLPARQFYITPRGPGDLAAHLYNKTSERMLAVAIRRQRGVRSKTISKYVSQLRAIEEEHLDMRLSVPGVGLKYNRMLMQMRREDGPSGERELQRGFRHSHLRRLAEPAMGYDRSSRFGVMRWALWHTMLQCLLRGGEAGLKDRQEFFEPRKHLNCRDGPATDPTNAFEWLPAGKLSPPYDRHPALIVAVLAIKDAKGHDDAAHRKRRPIVIIRRRPEGDSTPDAMCPYEAIAAAWAIMLAEVAEEDRDHTPFFRHNDGRAVATDDVKTLVRQAVTLLQLGDPTEWGAKSPRIGASTDLGMALGTVEAERIIWERGRWCSEIGQIYKRFSADEQAKASLALSAAEGVDLESLTGWTQPAEVRRRHSTR